MKNIPLTMKGVQLMAHGGPEVLKYSDYLTVPTPLENEVKLVFNQTISV